MRLVLVLAAVAFCGWSGWSYLESRHDPSVQFAAARDQVVRAGRQEIAVLNTLDPRSSDDGLRRWLDVSAGPLHDELQRDATENKRKIEQARTGARGTVTDLAVTELDARAGTAQVIATVEVRLDGTDLAPGMAAAAPAGRKRFSAVLSRTGRGWKLTSLAAVPVDAV
jgi:Mce-associated membrane protein